jgi:fructokinase
VIVVAGEALIDLVPGAPPARGTVVGRPGELHALLPRRGGGPYNTAVALGRLGSRTAFCSRVSTDSFGEALVAALVTAGVDTALVQRGPEPTTLAVTDIGADGSARYTFYAEGTADRLFELPGELPGEVRALALGTCSLVLEPGASAYERLMLREAARGVFVALDPNIRSNLIPDPAAHRARFRSWLPSIGLLKLSSEDAAWLAGSGSPEAAVEEWLASGVPAVVLTHGAAGLSVHTRTGRVAVPGIRTAVVDTVGAGDTAGAALLHRLGAHEALSHDAVAALGADDWRDILGFAARAAAVTCSRAGAEPPSAEELEGAPSTR